MKPKTILLVDDDFHIVKILSLKLKNAGFEVVTASNGAEALEVIEQVAPDLMISDYSMPEMTGLQLIEHVRALDAGKDIPVIMLTARGQDVESWGAEMPRIDLMLNKPFSPREVLSKVEELLEVHA